MRGSMNENVKAARSLAAQAITAATVTGAAVDRKGYEEALAFIEIGALGGTSPQGVFKVQESVDAAFTTPIDVSGATKTITDAIDDNKFLVGRINLVNRQRYIRWHFVGTGGSPTGSFAAGFILGKPTRPPATQAETELFNIT